MRNIIVSMICIVVAAGCCAAQGVVKVSHGKQADAEVKTASSIASTAKKATDENFRKADQTMWAKYQDKYEALRREMNAHPEKIDSLKAAAATIGEESARENVRTAVKFAGTEAGLQRLFALRKLVAKDSLKSILDTLPEEMQASTYDKCISRYISTQQAGVGEKAPDLDFTDSHYDKHKLSEYVPGRRVLIVLGSPERIGRDEVVYLKKLYEKIKSDTTAIIEVCQCNNQQELNNQQAIYNCKFPLVSDMNGDHSDMQIKYGVEEVPSAVVIDRDGTIIMKEDGMPHEKIEAMMKVSRTEQK
jgi:peroxiredoxin